MKACRRSRLSAHEHHKRVREDIPVASTTSWPTSATSRGGNTATILPNGATRAPLRPHHPAAREHHCASPHLRGDEQALGGAVAPPPQELTSEGNFYRTLWHEVGHYLGWT